MQLRLMIMLTLFAGFSLAGGVSSGRKAAPPRAPARKATSPMGRDLVRDNASRTIRLQTKRPVYKYTTRSQAREFERKGFPPRTHFTASQGPGRPLNGSTAQKRYGLPYTPSRRLGVTLPKGTSVKSNRVIGGAPGYGELRIQKRLAPAPSGSAKLLKSGRK